MKRRGDGRWHRFRGAIELLLDDAGEPPCAAPDKCASCRLFSGQRPDESRAEWLARILRTARYHPTGGLS